MMTMPALVGVGTLPTACAVAISKGENSAKGTRHEVDGLVVMTAYGDTLVLSERKPALIKDVKGTAAMATPILPACLAKVVEERRDSDAVGGDATRMGGHIFIYLK